MSIPLVVDTLLVVSGGVECERRRRNVYDKKPQRYAKDNRTAHLTAHSDKSVAYVTNNKTTRHFVLLKLDGVIYILKNFWLYSLHSIFWWAQPGELAG